MNRRDGKLDLVNRDKKWEQRQRWISLHRSIAQQARRAREEIRAMAAKALDDINARLG